MNTVPASAAHPVNTPCMTNSEPTVDLIAACCLMRTTSSQIGSFSLYPSLLLSLSFSQTSIGPEELDDQRLKQ